MAANKGKKPQKPSDQNALDELDAHIPLSLRGPVLKLSSEPAHVGDLPSVFIGIVDDDYTEEMWNRHLGQISSLFNISNALQIKVRNRGNMVDGKQLGQEMTRVIDEVNGTHGMIRIVGMGMHSALAVYQAVESLVRGWDLPWEEKTVQFVALGDSAKRDYLNLCKQMCLNSLCASIQFYTTMDYNDFGFLDLARTNPENMSHEKLEALLTHVF